MTAIDLLFSEPDQASADLRFGQVINGVDEHLDLVLTASVPAPSISGALVANYDNAVSRGPKFWNKSSWQTGLAVADLVAVANKSGQPKIGMTVIANAPGQPLLIDRSGLWKYLRRAQVAEPWISYQQATRQSSASTERFSQLSPRNRPALLCPYQQADRRPETVAERWVTLSMAVRPQSDIAWSVGAEHVLDQRHAFHAGRPSPRWRDCRWEEARLPAHGISDHTTPPVIPPGQYQPDTTLRFSDHQPASLALLFNKKSGTGPESLIVVPVRTLYMTINTQSVVIAETGADIEARNVRLSIDADSWTWRWSADVPAHYEAQLAAPIGNIVELIITLNGTPIRCAIEGRHRNRSFAKGGFNISGRGRAAWLADPHATKVSRTNATAQTAQQLMAAALTENGVSLGWDIDWRLTDWLVPAGAWSHTGAAIDACLAIAGAAGGYIQAHSTDQLLRVLPRYPVAPWEWSSLTPDIDLPEDVCTVEDIDEVDKPLYNSVYLSGQANGVLCHVTRAGTDGGIPAPMVVDGLITHSDAGRQGGLAILSDTGRQKTIGLSLPLLAETGIILPGKMVRYRESGNIHVGITRGVGISGDFPKIRQTITVETHVL